MSKLKYESSFLYPPAAFLRETWAYELSSAFLSFHTCMCSLPSIIPMALILKVSVWGNTIASFCSLKTVISSSPPNVLSASNPYM